MKKLMVLLALSSPLCVLACEAHHVSFKQGYVRATAPGQRVTAAYMNIQNKSKEPVTIVSISSPQAKHVMFHTNESDDDMVKMVESETLEIPAGETIRLEPGEDNMHVMMMDLEKPLTPKDKVTLTFTFDDDSTSEIYAIPVKDIRK